MPTGNASKHLKWSELACYKTDGNKRIWLADYPLSWMDTRGKRLAEAFERVRALFNEPLVVRSAYRTPEHNRAVGGASGSFHVQGLALDLAPPDDVPVVDFWVAIVDVALRTEIRGIGYASPTRGNYVHIDLRPSDTLVQWRY